ncbi:hypothetical protein [Erwinia sp. B116]|uniref:hypothetical protein n=1 Tax=Erwinia sp. B116 TaxID=1561024 RepID=UPI000C763449|nr:hypothetical protein [Erwinia sp. B116]PLV53683.1 hypothetical protein NV64_18730 [Erwinia sp. B116]
MGKNGFNPGQSAGVQYFYEEKERMTVLYAGSELPGNGIVNGEVVFIQRSDKTFWYGRTYHNMYWLEFQELIETVMVGVFHVRSEKHVAELHQDNDFVDRWELPF